MMTTDTPTQAQIVAAFCAALGRDLHVDFTHDEHEFGFVVDDNGDAAIEGTVWTVHDGEDVQVMTLRLAVQVTA
jgi:hypothetical protein